MSTIENVNTRLAAKTIAGLMVLQMVLGILLNFYFLKPLLTYDGSASVEEITFILGCATLVAILISSINLMFGLLLPKSRIETFSRTFTFLIVFAAVGIALCAVEYAKLAEYVTYLSSSFASDPNMEYFRKTLASGRNEAHFLSIFISSTSLAFFYVLVIRAELLPKSIGTFALLAVFLQLVAVGHTFFQAPIPNIIQLPIAISQLLVPIYLLLVGFKNTTNEDLYGPEQQSNTRNL